jgi:hypothetical protein
LTTHDTTADDERDPVEHVRQALQRAECDPEWIPMFRVYVATCPIHRCQSLRLTYGPRGTANLTCYEHPGCSLDDLCRALDLGPWDFRMRALPQAA